MRRILSVMVLCFFVSFAQAQEMKLGAIIERYDASFHMASQTTGTYKVNMRVCVLSTEAADEAVFTAYQDAFRSLSSFSGVLESGGKVIKKYKMSDLKTASVGEGSITEATVSYLQPVAPVPYVVEYTYEMSYKNGFITFPSFIPVTEPDVTLMSASYTISVPPGTELMYYSSMEPVKETGEKADTYKWEVPQFHGYVHEHMMPSIYEKVPYLYVGPKSFTYSRTNGEQTDWNTVGMWLYGLQKDVCAVPDALRAKVGQLTAGASSDREKIKILYEYLRQNTRYVSIQLGIGGMKPFPVETVMNSGFGDCKALSVYMQALLSAAGIHSEYLIVNTDRRDLFKDYYSVGQMNHAMLCVPMQKDTLWIECTNPRLPLGYRHDDIAGHEVVLVGEKGGQKVRVRPYPDSLRRSVESFEVALNADGSAHCVGLRHLVLDDVEAYVGFSALTDKTKFDAIMGANSLTPDNFRILSVTDNFEDWVNMEDGEEYIPETDIRYEFDAAKYAKVSGDRIFLDLNPFAKQVRADRKQRVNDYVRSRMLIIEDAVSVKLPDGYTVESMPSSSTISSPFGTLQTDVAFADGKLNVVQTLTMNPGRFTKEEYDLYRTFAKDVTKAYSTRVVLRKDQ